MGSIYPCGDLIGRELIPVGSDGYGDGIRLPVPDPREPDLLRGCKLSNPPASGHSAILLRRYRLAQTLPMATRPVSTILAGARAAVRPL